MSSLVFLLLCLSLHATSARYLGVTDLETNKGFQVLGKGLEEEKLHKAWIASSVKPFFSEGIQKQVQQVGKNDETGVHESWGGANFIKQKDRNAYNKVVGVSVNEVMASSVKEILPEATKIEVWKTQARRMLGSRPDDAEETVDSKGNNVVEDIVVMDYAQPHRKPPIHNIEP